MKTKLLKIGKIAGIYYSCGRPGDTVVVYGIGAPIVPDSGNLPDAPVILNHGIDLFVPDYIGYGRSEGVFTPKNCIKTFLVLFETLKIGCVGINHYENTTVKLKYKRIIFIGRSLGGAYVPLLPKFNPLIKDLAIFCPAVDQKAQGEVEGEETNEDGLSPMDNIKYLAKARLFIAHGKKDECIHYSKSVKYYRKILKKIPNNKDKIKIVLYPNGGHGHSTTKKAADDFLKWIEASK